MDISRRRALGFLGVGGGVGLASCATSGTVTDSGSSYFRMNSTDVSFDHGVATGDAMADRIVFWTRATPASNVPQVYVTLVYSTDEQSIQDYVDGVEPQGPSQILFDHVETSASRDFTVKTDVNGLAPDTVYYYAFIAQTKTGLVVSSKGRTRTLPTSGGEKLSLAVISCSNWPFGYFNAYKALSERDDIDAVVHLGDYIYEYGIDGYGGDIGEQLGRRHDPVTEIVSLEDYRTRHRQYKTDPNLQAAHARAPWFCTWDDHESTNDSYRTGAQNHNPEDNEGDWTSRKQRAVQAYLEWMPVRDPQPGRAQESIYRKVDFGDLATIFMLESRLTGRSDEISWFDELTPDMSMPEVMTKVGEVRQRVDDPSRTMLGKVQEDWLDAGLKSSVSSGKTWQLLANQVIMAEVKPPNLPKVLTEEQKALLPPGFGQMLMMFSPLEQAWNLDAWDGFTAARKRLYSSAQDAGARLVTITGDTHTAWANDLHNGDALVGVEFGCTSVTSPGLGTSIPIENMGQLFADANEDVVWHDPFGNGFTMLTLTPEKAVADFYKVTTVLEEDFAVEWVAGYETTLDGGKVTPLRSVV
ncbi:MAG: alkaline phosphatase [Ponticaulis sp.]|nr:alkaline phosphatase [Ponticaulis sp.]